MKESNIFRPVEFWKSAVMTMPDNSFFELVRSVFGKIKTPFKKQQLVNDLETFLLREDIQKTIAAYIDQDDAKIIAAIALFGEPVFEDIVNFFSGELNCAQLQDMIVNLEERFILYRYKEEKKNISGQSFREVLNLNPVLEQVLLPFAKNVSMLFPAIPAGESIINSPPKAAALNDRILAGLFSFVSAFSGESFFRGESEIRKKIIDAGKICFPGINSQDMDLPFILGSLQVLGLFYTDGDRLVADKKHFDDFGAAADSKLSFRERSEYCAAAMLVYSEVKPQGEILPPLYRGKIREAAGFIHKFLDGLAPDFLYHEKYLVRLAEVLKMKTGTKINTGALLNFLGKTGLLGVTGDNSMFIISCAKETAVKGTDAPVIANDSGFSFIVYPEICFADTIALASFMNIREAGTVVRFELDKDSAVRSFDKNISADTIIDLLNRLSGSRISENIVWTLKDWEKRHGEVSIRKGVVLTLAKEHHCLAETKWLASLITETLAPGVYLLPEDSMGDAAAALRSAGIDIIARSGKSMPDINAQSKSASPFGGNKWSSQFPALASGEDILAHSAVQLQMPPQGTNPSTAGFGSNATALTTVFHGILEKTTLDNAAQKELAARIDRKLILCETQLKEADVRYEKLEAKLLDYAGKQNIAKQAIAQKSPLEIVLQENRTEKRIFGIPRALEKEKGELVLVIEPEEKDSAETIRVPLAKMILLRKIKKSIFETN